MYTLKPLANIFRFTHGMTMPLFAYLNDGEAYAIHTIPYMPMYSYISSLPFAMTSCTAELFAISFVSLHIVHISTITIFIIDVLLHPHCFKPLVYPLFLIYEVLGQGDSTAIDTTRYSCMFLHVGQDGYS